MITYGHENYIREAIEGVLMQQIDFSVELIIANDCSPDNTDIIVNDIIATNKSTIEIVYKKHDKNIGMMANFIFALNLAKGKYVALCDGDDYWTDPLKLQKQVDFLEENQDYSIIGHNLFILKDEELKEVIANEWVHSQCAMFRSNLLDKNYYKVAKKVFNCDTLLYHFLRLKGKSISLDFFGAVYRKTGNGVYTYIEKDKQKLFHAKKTYLEILKLHKLNYQYSKLNIVKIENKLFKIFEKILKIEFTYKNYFSFIKILFQFISIFKLRAIKKVLSFI